MYIWYIWAKFAKYLGTVCTVKKTQDTFPIQMISLQSYNIPIENNFLVDIYFYAHFIC
jgi:hypothetical protein